jgi:NADH:ubiquinone oxidoreductase subunit
MANISVFGSLSNIQILVHTFFSGKKVGRDVFGNTYYRAAPRRGSKRERRWVIYHGPTEASAIPPEWHGWMHHQTNHPPASENRHRKNWQKPHQPNLTGTRKAHSPSGGALPKSYTAWSPKE